MKPNRRLAIAGTVLAGALGATGCLPLAATGVGVAAMAALDRRTIGAQTEDTEIELRAGGRLRDVKGAEGVTVTSYNRRVLLTGQVSDDRAKAEAVRVVRLVQGVREVHDETEVGMRPALSTTAIDTGITTRVMANYVNERALSVNAVKAVTDGGVVYLMGLVTRREGPAYARVASQVSGVRRVVTLFEYISDEELERLNSRR